MMHFESRQIKNANQADLRRLFDQDEGHDIRIHRGKSFKRDGFRMACRRCLILSRIKEQCGIK